MIRGCPFWPIWDGRDEKGEKALAGENAFKLYDTYGFPLDLTKEILEEKGMAVDEKGFKDAMEIQRKTAREAREVTNYMGADVTVYESIDPGITTEFVGYDNLSYESEVTVLATDTELADALSDGERGTIFVKRPHSMPPAAARRRIKESSAPRTANLSWRMW